MGGRRPLRLTLKGAKYIWPPQFSGKQHPLGNNKFEILTEIDPECSQDLFFGLHLNLGAKFRTEIELLSLTKLLKNILHPRNLLNQQKIDAYGRKLNVNFVTHKIRVRRNNSEW